MRGLFIALAIVAVVVVVGIVSYKMTYPIIDVRFRLTVEVQDGDQIKSGSGVIEVSYAIQPDALAAAGGFNSFSDVKGSAITIDLGETGLLLLTFWDTTPTPAQRAERQDRADVACEGALQALVRVDEKAIL